MTGTFSKGQKGFSLIELLISVMLTSFLMLTGFAAINIVARSIGRTTLAKVLVETKSSLVESALNPTAMAYTIADTSNTGMACLRDQTDCAGVLGGTFKLRNRRNEVVFDSTNTASGFGMNGELCNTFDSARTDNICPFRYELTWAPVCPSGGATCLRPVIRVSGRFISRQTSDHNSDAFNADRLSFSIMNSSGTTDVPYVHGDIIYLDRGTSVTVDVLTNSWPGTTAGTLRLTSVAPPGHGTASVDASGFLVYTPTPTYFGLDSANITVTSDHGETTTTTVWFKVMTPFTWTGDSGDTLWTTARNWCGTTNATHTGCVGSSFSPGSTETAIFDGTCAGNCVAFIDPGSDSSVVRIKGINITFDFMGELSTRTGILWVDSDGFTQAGGKFTSLGGSSMVATLNFTLTGGIFKAPSGILEINKHMTITSPSSFIANSGTVKLTTGDSIQNISAANVTFNNFEFANGNDGGHIDLGGATINVTGLLDVHPWLNHFCAHFQNGTINASGNVKLSQCGAVGNGLLVLKGNPAGQLIEGLGTSGKVTRLKIETGTNPVKFVGTIEIAGDDWDGANYNYVSSGTYDWSAGILKFTGITPASIQPGSLDYNDVVINTLGDGGDVNLNGTTMKVRGKLTLAIQEYHWCPAAMNGTFEAYGDIDVANCGMPGTAVVKVMGKATGQTITTSAGSLGTLRIEAGANPLNIVGDLRISGGLWGTASYTYVSSGAVNWGASKLVFATNSPVSINPGALVYESVVFNGNGDSGYLNLNGNTMKIRTKATIWMWAYHSCGELNNGTILLQGTLDVSNSPGCGNGSVVITTVPGPLVLSAPPEKFHDSVGISGDVLDFIFARSLRSKQDEWCLS